MYFMKAMKLKSILIIFLALLSVAAQAQTKTGDAINFSSKNPAQAEPVAPGKKYSVSAGFGYYSPQISAEGVSYPDAEFSPETGVGISGFASFDYALTTDLYVGIGYNGSYGKAKFIKNATIYGQQISGYLEAGALENSHFVLNVTYFPAKGGLQPYAKLGLGYFISELELGDIPLELTNNVETELFPDYKSQGFGVLPELGIKYNRFTLSAAYGIPFNKLTSEDPSEPDAYTSSGSIRSHNLQINVGYRFFVF